MSFLRGIRDAVPIGAGYLAVAFSLGITARNAGIAPVTGFFSSLFTRASAGEYAVYTLMGASLTQKFAADMPLWKRILASCCITDEIFGISIAYKGDLPLSYPVGATVLAGTMWGLGTALGIAAGNILPEISEISSGIRIVILTLAVSTAAAILKPVDESKS